MSDDKQSPSRRRLIKSLVFVPMGVGAAGALHGGLQTAGAAATAAPEGKPNPYTPTFFNADEWRFLNAAVDRLIPHDEHGPGAIELGVPEFIDRHMKTPYAHGSIWYMSGPWLDAPPEFGYQGKLPLCDILRVGMKNFDNHCAQQFNGKKFADLDKGQQEAMLKEAEGNKLKFPDISGKIFFANLLAETRNGYFADPGHGGNKGMGSWKMIGYPGMRADYLDWVEVRDRAYPIPPVDLAGNRG
ncbi:gluconate 2-dehydrogenase subunit 3 family protein [Massilia forsythiae]|uniref:Gluconate 2-dehydrogenase subunit 3 family protein n=1 Tax=Massilia forsythiae TaxID=2728020 RepID=A0A7Z2ZUS1_9BURK|nr:gluconate 2-dehydrogenase subunit 3 family protein [Massilia forsythiae]QJE02966.1 gluconate 2-dehydrogenase subunit 3 family protein [Massilia forsythiae]